MSELLNVTFAVTTGQLETLTTLPKDLESQRAKVAKIEAERVAALVLAMRSAGIEVRDMAPARGSSSR